MSLGVILVGVVLLAGVVWAIMKSKREAPSLFKEDGGKA